MTKAIEQQYQFHPFTVEDYYRMAEVGILSWDDRVELLDGKILSMTPIGALHAACVDRLTRIFVPAFPKRIVRIQGPVRLNLFSEPEPDVILLRPDADFYSKGHPAPKDVDLIVEVSDTTFQKDMQVKLPLYAKAGIPEVWIVHLPKEQVHVFRRPKDGEYRQTQIFQGSDTILTGLPIQLSVQQIMANAEEE